MKQELVKLIEMYAAARASSNSDLVSLAAEKLNLLLSKTDLIELPPSQQGGEAVTTQAYQPTEG